MGLASGGPTSACRIGPPADITLRNITAVLEASEVSTDQKVAIGILLYLIVVGLVWCMCRAAARKDEE